MEELRMMTMEEAREFVKEEIAIQREISSCNGERFSREDRKEIIWATIYNLEDLGKIDSEQAKQLAKKFKIEY